MEFKGTKGKWEVIEHSWSTTSIVCNGKNVASSDIEYEATEENQIDLQVEARANSQLISKAPEMLEMLKQIVNNSQGIVREDIISDAEQLIKEATEIK